MNWSVETFRFSGFLEHSWEKQPESWINSITKNLPDIKNVNPKKNISHEELDEGNKLLVIETQPIRIDLIQTINIKAEIGELDIPAFGYMQDEIDNFIQYVKVLITNDYFPELTRIALGMILLEPISNRKEGYSKLNELLPFNIEIENSSDFFYQINRPRYIEQKGNQIKINRLTKWSVIELSSVIFQVKPSPKTVNLGQKYYAIRNELDVNTTIDYEGVFSITQIESITNELVSMAIEISNEGDIP